MLHGCRQPEGSTVMASFSSPRLCLSLLSLPPSPHISASPPFPLPSAVSVIPLLPRCSRVPSSFGFPSLYSLALEPISPLPDLPETHRWPRALLRLMARRPRFSVPPQISLDLSCYLTSCILSHLALHPLEFQLLHLAHMPCCAPA